MFTLGLSATYISFSWVVVHPDFCLPNIYANNPHYITGGLGLGCLGSDYFPVGVAKLPPEGLIPD